MSKQPSDVVSLARSKLHSSFGGNDNCSLHRWVLLKNSLVRPQSEVANPAASNPSFVPPVCNAHHYNSDEDDDVDYNSNGDDDVDSFMFPDASKITGHDSPDAESEWLDSLLKELEDSEDDDVESRKNSDIDLDDFQITTRRVAAPGFFDDSRVWSGPLVSSVGTRRHPHSKLTASRVGLMARLASRVQSYLSAPHDDASRPAEDQTQSNQRGRRPLGRAFAFVSVGRAKDRVFARGGGNKRRNSRQEPEDDDDRDIPSPDPEDAARTSPSD